MTAKIKGVPATRAAGQASSGEPSRQENTFPHPRLQISCYESRGGRLVAMSTFRTGDEPRSVCSSETGRCGRSSAACASDSRARLRVREWGRRYSTRPRLFPSECDVEARIASSVVRVHHLSGPGEPSLFDRCDGVPDRGRPGGGRWTRVPFRHRPGHAAWGSEEAPCWRRGLGGRLQVAEAGRVGEGGVATPSAGGRHSRWRKGKRAASPVDPRRHCRNRAPPVSRLSGGRERLTA